jgi:hypothetical protein
MSWCLNSEFDDKLPLDMHIKQMFLKLHPKAKPMFSANYGLNMISLSIVSGMFLQVVMWHALHP